MQSNAIQCRAPSKGRFYNCHPKSTPTWLVPKASHNCCPEKPTRRSPKLKRETSKSLHPSIFIFLPTRKPSKRAPFASTTRHHSTSVLKREEEEEEEEEKRKDNLGMLYIQHQKGDSSRQQLPKNASNANQRVVVFNPKHLRRDAAPCK
jgi:hypothetical protein